MTECTGMESLNAVEKKETKFSSTKLLTRVTVADKLVLVQVHKKSYFTTQYFRSFPTFLLYINGLCFTIHVIKLSCHCISMNHQAIFVYKYKIHSYENTTIYFKNIPMKTH